MQEQAATFVRYAGKHRIPADIVMRDRDTKFTESFDEVLKSAKREVKKAAHRSPNAVAFVERSIQTLQQERLGYFVVFGQVHMDHIVREFITH